MAEEKEILIKISADIEELKTKIGQATSDIESSFQKTTHSIQSQGQNIIQIMSQIAIAMQLIVPLGRSLDESFKVGFSELKQIEQYSSLIKKFNSSFSSAEIEDYIGKLQKLSGFSDTELRNAFTRAVIITKDASKALEMLGIAVDIASAGTIDLSTVAWSLAQVSQGVEYGIRMLARQLGIAKSETEDVDKLMETLRNRFGGLASEIQKTTIGGFTQFQLAVGDLKEEFGKIVSEGTEPFYRSLSKITYSLVDQVKALKNSETSLADFIKTASGVIVVQTKIASSAANVVSSIIPMINTFLLAKMAGGGLGTAITGLGTSLTALLGPLGVLIASLPAIIPMLSQLFKIWSKPEEAEKSLKALESINDILTYKIPSQEIPVKPLDTSTVEKSMNEIEKIMVERGKALGEKFSKQIEQNTLKDAIKNIEMRGKAYEDYINKVFVKEIEEKRIAEEKRKLYLADLEKRASIIKEELLLSKMSEDEKVRYRIQKEIESNLDLVREGKLTYDQLKAYAELKFKEIDGNVFKETAKNILSWAKAELIGPSNLFMAELTGFSFARKLERREIAVDVYLRSATGIKVSQEDAENIGRAIVNQMKLVGV